MFTIRKAQKADCAALAGISARAFSQPMSESEFLRELETGFSLTLVADIGGKAVGFINIWIVYGEADLNNIAVLEEHRGRGLGQALLDEGLKACADCGSMTLEVRRSNKGAIAFYEKNGFELLGERKDFYEKPTEDALIYKRSIK